MVRWHSGVGHPIIIIVELIGIIVAVAVSVCFKLIVACETHHCAIVQHVNAATTAST